MTEERRLVSREELAVAIAEGWAIADAIFAALPQPATEPALDGHALNPDHLDNPLRDATQPSAEVERLRAADGRWAFLNPETGDWIEVKSGVVYLAGSDRP